MKKSEAFIENRIKWRASKHNLPNKHVLLFEHLDKKTRREYLREVNREETGKLVLLFTYKKSWTAVGTKMIVGFDGKEINTITFKEIKDINAKHSEALMRASAIKRLVFRKKFERDLLITDVHKNEVTFLTQPGVDFFALWNITLMLARMHDAPYS